MSGFAVARRDGRHDVVRLQQAAAGASEGNGGVIFNQSNRFFDAFSLPCMLVILVELSTK